MATSKNHRNCHVDSHRRGKLAERSSSFCSQTSTSSSSSSASTMSGTKLRRPKTVPDLKLPVAAADVSPRQPPKLLLKVTMMRSLGPVLVVMSPESTVGDLVAAVVRQYVKEGRRPILPSGDPSQFDLHYSQFSLESLDRKEKLCDIGSRNFFMCLRGDVAGNDSNVTTPFAASCSREVDTASKGGGGGGGWLKFMDFLSK